jgi:CheY-like chemotaxis protein
MTTAASALVTLAGLRVLVVEDEALIAMDLAATLRRVGCTTIGPARHVATAMCHVASDAPDVALLDVNLAGEEVFPVADALADRQVPFVFLTGYGRNVIPDRFRDRPLLGKPYSTAPLLATLERLTGRRGA